jgi:hypothetical protein
VKGAVARAGSRKYYMHGANRVLQPARLRDGQATLEFLRANPHWGGVSRGETADGIAEVLTRRVLKRLVTSGGMCVLYTHLGKITRRDQPFPPAAREAWRRLATLAREGQILVTTTRRLLGYCEAAQHVRGTLTPGRDADRLDLTLGGRSAPGDFQGLTFEVRDPARTTVWIDGAPLAPVQQNPPDASGRRTVTIPWTRLAFPAV